MPDLLGAPTCVPPAMVLFAVFRNSSETVAARYLVREWVLILAKFIGASSFNGQFKTHMPATNLPEYVGLSQVKRAYRGEDKVLLVANKFLAKFKEFARADDQLFQDTLVLSFIHALSN